MMADMGIQSLDDLSRDERSRFIKAVLGVSRKKERRTLNSRGLKKDEDGSKNMEMPV